ncbi:MAG: efflux transporter periplasmic adaptor subunit, partial [Desulfobia sp.]
ILLPQKEEVVTIPQTAVDYNPYGNVVFLLSPLNEEHKGNPVYKASRRFVALGRTRGSQVAVDEGLEPGEKVVISGRHKLREGVKAVIDNSVVPDSSPDPRVEEK